MTEFFQVIGFIVCLCAGVSLAFLALCAFAGWMLSVPRPPVPKLQPAGVVDQHGNPLAVGSRVKLFGTIKRISINQAECWVSIDLDGNNSTPLSSRDPTIYRDPKTLTIV